MSFGRIMWNWNMEKKQNCCAYTDSFIPYVKKDEIHKETGEDVETRFDASSYELNRPLPKWKNKKVIGIMKDELCRKVVKEFFGLGAKIYT